MLRFSRLRYEATRDRFDEAVRDYRRRSLRLVAGVLGLTMTAMLVLLLSSPAAVRLTEVHQSGQSSSWCHDASSSDYQRYQSALKTLQISSIAKAVLLSSAWFLLCMVCDDMGIEWALVSVYMVTSRSKSRWEYRARHRFATISMMHAAQSVH
ncbi:hypothetical protein PINS_up002677 [Pythium insidiosum]|nr:hypothetical protein PINS_up002677 [Pythium insidiosum]